MKLGFEYPIIIALGFISLLFLILFIHRFKRNYALSLPLGPPGGAHFKAPIQVDALVRILKFLEIIGIALLIVAAASPIVISSEVLWLSRGADVLFILDVSPSMSALDMDGKNRFDTARNLVRSFAELRKSDAIGLVAVGGEAALLIPPTIDRQALNTRLESLSIAELGDGTALGMGIAVAAHHLRYSRAQRRAAVLITDGENNAGAVHPITAAGALSAIGASLWVIGVGSSGTVPIDYVDPLTKLRRTGIFESRFDTEALRAIAKTGGGTYIAAPSAAAFTEAFSKLESSEATVQRSRLIPRTRPIYIPFILVALGFLVLARIVRRFFLGAFL